MRMKTKKTKAAQVGRPMERVPTGPGTAMARFLIEHLPTLDMTNAEIAERFGYARPNIVSSWKTASTKFTLDQVFSLAELMGLTPPTSSPSTSSNTPTKTMVWIVSTRSWAS